MFEQRRRQPSDDPAPYDDLASSGGSATVGDDAIAAVHEPDGRDAPVDQLYGLLHKVIDPRDGDGHRRPRAWSSG